MKYYLDLHTHTLVSGHAYSTLTENCRQAKKIGLAVLGTSEHAPSMPGTCTEYYFSNLRIVPPYVEEQRLLKGIELNIMGEDGSVDLNERICNELDYCIASLHWPCFKSSDAKINTNAYINVMKHPYVKVIGHPDDSSIPVEMERFVLACKEHGVLPEINNSSLAPTTFRVGTFENACHLLELCKQYEVDVIFGSDAHYCELIGNFENCERAVQAVDFPMELVVNTNPEKIKKYFKIDVTELK